MSRPSATNPLHLATCLFGIGVVFALLSSCEAHGAQRVCRVQKQVAVVQQVVAQPVVASPVYYNVAPQLQQQGMALDGDAYQELLELRAWKAGYDEGRAKQTDPPAAATMPPTPLEPTPAEPTPAVEQTFEQRYPLIVNKCTRCHGGKDPDNPDGGLFLNGTVSLEPSEHTYGKLGRMAVAVVNGRMPQGHGPLQPQDEYDFLVQLFTEHERPDPNPEGE